jgi:ABC-2 type transport system ATP-binding protein
MIPQPTTTDCGSSSTAASNGTRNRQRESGAAIPGSSRRRRLPLLNVLVVDKLVKRYGDVVALNGVSFQVGPGEIVGFLGPNGAGKTTTMRAIMGLVSLDGGAVLWKDRAVDPGVRQRFGYMPAERGMYQRMKVRDHLMYYAAMCGLRGSAGVVVGQWLERLGLGDRAGDTVQSLSSGNQQRVQLALALINEPDLLVLDEPFSGLDPIAVEMLSDVLRQQVARGVALLLSSHQLDLVADVCSSVVIVERGAVVMRGDVAEIRAASPTRYVDIEFAGPTTFDARAHAALNMDGDRRRYRIAVHSDLDPSALIADAHASGPVLAYSFAPPDLSEVFMAAIRRPAADGSGDSGDAGGGVV